MICASHTLKPCTSLSKMRSRTLHCRQTSISTAIQHPLRKATKLFNRCPEPTLNNNASRTMKPTTTTAAFNSDGGGIGDDLSRILDKYVPANLKPAKYQKKQPAGMGNGLFTILLLNFGLFAASHFWHPGWTSLLCLNHMRPHWWQFITATFMHYNWEHLIGNAFSLLIFGRTVEEEEGAFGVWATYLLCGAGGCLASYLSSPHTATMSLGASSAVFGLFVVGVVTKLKFNVKRLLEAVILGSFVTKQVLGEVSMVSSGKAAMIGGVSVGHWAHLGGAAAAVVLIMVLSRLDSQ